MSMIFKMLSPTLCLDDTGFCVIVLLGFKLFCLKLYFYTLIYLHLFIYLSSDHSVPEEGRQWWSKCRSKQNIASCVIMKFVWNILPT